MEKDGCIALTLRLDIKNDSTYSLLEKYLRKYDYKYLVYEEVSDKKEKLHYQGIFWVPEKEHNACKSRWSTMFKDWTRGQKSMAIVKKSSYEIYCTKDKSPIFRNKYTDEEISALEDQSYKKKPERSENETTFQKAFNYCKEHGIDTYSDGWIIAETLIDYYREKVKCEPNDFQLKNMAKSIYTHCVYEKALAQGNMGIYTSYKQQRAKQIMGSEWIYS